MAEFSPTATVKQREQAYARLVADLKADGAPIIIGPWRSEVGFEGLYWLPFLRKLATQVPDFEKRAAVITRGGLAPFYPASKGVDLYTLRSVTEVRRENLYDHQHAKVLKQMKPTTWDGDVTAEAADTMGLGALYHEIHPAWMYWTLEPFWAEQVGLRYLLNYADFAPLKKPVLPEGIDANLKFVAVKFYGRATFPYPDPDIAAFVQRTVSQLATQTQVVLLSSSSEYDDHGDIPMSGPNVMKLPDNLAPEQNLIVQAAVLAHATAFIGTYGGVAQMALRMGIPSVSFWSGRFQGTAHAHLSLSLWLSQQTGTPFLAGSLTDSQLWAQVVGGVMVKRTEVARAETDPAQCLAALRAVGDRPEDVPQPRKRQVGARRQGRSAVEPGTADCH